MSWEQLGDSWGIAGDKCVDNYVSCDETQRGSSARNARSAVASSRSRKAAAVIAVAVVAVG